MLVWGSGPQGQAGKEGPNLHERVMRLPGGGATLPTGEAETVANYTREIRTIGTLLSRQSKRVIWVDTTPVPNNVTSGPERHNQYVLEFNAAANAVMTELQIPTSDAFSSLNLAAAVQLLGYAMFVASINRAGIREKPIVDESDRPSFQIEMEHFFDHAERVLDARGYLEGEMRVVTLMKLRRLFNRARPHSGELKLLHTMMKMIHRGDK